MKPNCANCRHREVFEGKDSILNICVAEGYEPDPDGMVQLYEVTHFDASMCRLYEEIPYKDLVNDFIHRGLK